jgi:hypothetical protein
MNDKIQLADRFESKFLFTGLSCSKLKNEFLLKGLPSYSVSTCYLDSSELDSYHQSLEGSYYKQKYRVRYYNQDTSKSYWEVKKKCGQLTTKSRCKINFNEEIQESHILSQVHYDLRPEKLISKTVKINYRRLILRDIPGFRITFDYDIKFQGYKRTGEFRNTCVIEMKTDRPYTNLPCLNAIPPTELANHQNKFSKYFYCMKALSEDINNAF